MIATTAIKNRNGGIASSCDCILKYYHPHRCRATLRFNPQGGPSGGLQLHRQGENRYAVDPNIEIRFQMHDSRAIWAVSYAGGLMLDAGRRLP